MTTLNGGSRRSCICHLSIALVWVLAQVLDAYADESKLALLLQRRTFEERMVEAGLGDLHKQCHPPRKACKVLSSAAGSVSCLLDESAQRSMLAAIGNSLASYASGIRCWAAFMDATGSTPHFPATAEGVCRYIAIFAQGGTMNTYLKHLRWAHRFLRLQNCWHTEVIKQVCRGRLKLSNPPREKLALQAKQVRELIRMAEEEGDIEQCALLAVGRLCLSRMPSECFPLEVRGEHSEVQIESDVLRILLVRRKHTNRPTLIERSCCCRTSGRRLCAVHMLVPVLEHARRNARNRIFTKTMKEFIHTLRRHAAILGYPASQRLGSHSLRRGMARDIVDAGGSLAVLLRAGDWRSSAFLRYLRDHQVEECAVSQLAIDHSDSEDIC
jgi:hypothetical protein